MVDFKLLREEAQMPVKYRFEAFFKPHGWMEPRWEEIIFKGHVLEGERGCIARADSTRDKLFPLGVRVIEIDTNKVVYTAEKRRFGDFAINVQERR